jgi:hypothetical protein
MVEEGGAGEGAVTAAQHQLHAHGLCLTSASMKPAAPHLQLLQVLCT